MAQIEEVSKGGWIVSHVQARVVVDVGGVRSWRRFMFCLILPNDLPEAREISAARPSVPAGTAMLGLQCTMARGAA